MHFLEWIFCQLLRINLAPSTCLSLSYAFSRLHAVIFSRALNPAARDSERWRRNRNYFYSILLRSLASSVRSCGCRSTSLRVDLDPSDSSGYARRNFRRASPSKRDMNTYERGVQSKREEGGTRIFHSREVWQESVNYIDEDASRVSGSLTREMRACSRVSDWYGWVRFIEDGIWFFR